MEYNVVSKPWRPLCIERHYEGHRRVDDGEIGVGEVRNFENEWAARLLERGYHNPIMGQLQRVAVPKRSSLSSKL